MCNFYAGKTWQIKIQELQDKLKEKGCYGVVVAALDEVACESVIYFLVPYLTKVKKIRII